MVQEDPVLSTLFIFVLVLVFIYICDCVIGFLFVIVDITSVRGFAFNLYFILVLETTGLVLTFFGIVSSTFNKLPFVLTLGATRKISEPNISHPNLSKTVPLSIIFRIVLNK